MDITLVAWYYNKTEHTNNMGGKKTAHKTAQTVKDTTHSICNADTVKNIPINLMQ
jgi:hypothetical protein